MPVSDKANLEARAEAVLEIYTEFADYDKCVLGEYKYVAYQLVPGWVVEYCEARRALFLGGGGADAPQATSRILDLGCGTGLSGAEFFKHPGKYEVTGLDLVPAMLERAALLPYKALITENMEGEWHVPDADFEGIVMIGVYEFILYPVALLQQVKRKLKPNGVFGLTIPLHNPPVHKYGVQTFNPKKVLALVKAQGFRILKQKQFHGWQVDRWCIKYLGIMCTPETTQDEEEEAVEAPAKKQKKE